MSRSCSLFTDSLHNSADHLGRHAELRGVQHGKDLVRRRDQAPLFGEADDGGCARNPEAVFLGDRPPCAFIDQQQRGAIMRQRDPDAGGFAFVQFRERGGSGGRFCDSQPARTQSLCDRVFARQVLAGEHLAVHLGRHGHGAEEAR